MKIKPLILLIIATMVCEGVTATRSPFQTAQATLFTEATDFFEGKNYQAAITYYNDFLNYVPSTLDASDERIRVAKQNIAISSYVLRYDNAATLLTTYIKEFPYTQNRDQVELYLGVLEFERGKYKLAVKRFEKISVENLTDAEYLQLVFYRGYCYLQQNNYEKASAEFKQVLKEKQNAYTEPSHYYYGYSQFYLKNYQEALKHLEKAQEIPDFKSTTPYLMLQCHYYLGNCDQAIKMATRQINDFPKNAYLPEIKHILASCQFKEGKYAEALENMLEYKKAKKKFTREDFYMTGISYFNTDNPKSAIDNLTKVTKPDDAITQNAYFHIGMSYLALGDKKQARMAFESATRYDYDKSISCDALYDYALITYELSYAPFNESVSAFEKFLKTYPDSKYCPKVYEYLVNVYLTTKNYGAAYASIQNIEKKTPEILEAEQRVLFGMGTTQIANRKYGQAAESFQKLLAGKSYNADLTARANFWLGECQYRSGKYAQSIGSFKQYLQHAESRVQEEYAYAHYDLGYAYLKLGDKAESNAWFGKFTALQNTDKQMLTDAYNRMGDNWFTERRFTEAKQAYNNAQAVADRVAGADYAIYQTALICGLEKDYEGKITALQTLLTKYPKSEWTDDAIFEIGKSYVALNDNQNAINTFTKVATTYPKANPLVRQSKLQIAMLSYNGGNVERAISMYKEVATQYPGTEEAATSLQTLENIMVDSNRVSEYAELASSLNKVKGNNISINEDSLIYKAAEKSYFRNEYLAASEGFKTYREKYPRGEYNHLALTYLADCSYNLGQWSDVITYYTEILSTATDAEIISEARYRRMTATVTLGQDAADDISALRTDTRNAYGAEAEYLYIQGLYDKGEYAAAKDEVFAFIDKGTPHAYYLAKAFLVLSDCYVQEENYFDARQYLLSLQENYSPAPEDITREIEGRIENIEIKEK